MTPLSLKQSVDIEKLPSMVACGQQLVDVNVKVQSELNIARFEMMVFQLTKQREQLEQLQAARLPTTS